MAGNGPPAVPQRSARVVHTPIPRARQRVRAAVAIAGFCVVCAVAMVACNHAHSAKWYMQHGEAMGAKVKECQADAKLADDQDCRNATEAFVTWARATTPPASAPVDAPPSEPAKP